MPSSAAPHRPRVRRFEAAMRKARSRSTAPLSPNGIVRDPAVSAAHAALKTPAARAAVVAWPARADPSGDVFVDLDGTPLIHPTGLEQHPACRPQANSAKPL